MMHKEEKLRFRHAICNILKEKRRNFTDEELIEWKRNQGMISAANIGKPRFRAQWLKDARIQIGLAILSLEPDYFPLKFRLTDGPNNHGP
jgi:hypothetical protein